MVVVLVPVQDRVLLRSMADHTLQCMAHNRWLSVTEICSVVSFFLKKIEAYMQFIEVASVIFFLINAIGV